MAILKCKMCGGDLVIEPEMTVCECEYCGTKQTVPNTDDEKKVKLYERANRLRMRSEFDKAGSVYESLIEEFPEDAEAYWGNLLCKYGIEYVDDPATGDKVPTCHRSSFDSIMDDPDFDMVMENADSVARGVYRDQAKQIEEIRKGIVEVSGKEPPYDIFICYKETDDSGDRTVDSVIAQDVYEALTEKGYRVFFSRISLEDKLGTEYEPYIFAALNSAKIMLAFGTSYDYYNAVWVKNEWSRYLKLMAKDKSKHLIPCYKDIDAYDMPKEFAHLQAQDVGKVGAIQDLIRGIDKLIGHDGTSPKQDIPVQTVVQQVTGGPNVASLIDRGNMFLEDGKFAEATDYYNRALDIDSRSAEAYLGLFMAGINVKNQAAAKEAFISGDLTKEPNWNRAKQFAGNDLLIELKSWESGREERLEREARIQEEADRKQRAYEEEKEKIKEELACLQEQMKSGDFELAAEEQEELDHLQNEAGKVLEEVKQAENEFETCQEKKDVARLESEIRSKEGRMGTLGIFKGKEKKELQAQIDALNTTLSEIRMKVEERQKELERLRQISVETHKKLDEYKAAIIEKKMSPLKEKEAEYNNRLIELDLLTANVGDTVIFGSYEQGSGIAPVEWQVLDKQEGSIMLISKYGLDCKKYHEEQKEITWEKCDLRKWLNKDFLTRAFTKDEQRMIEERNISADKNPKYSTDPGKSTIDKVFLLSITEANKYFSSYSERRCQGTALCYAQGEAKWKNGNCRWWLRSPGDISLRAADVSDGGSVDHIGCLVDIGKYAVRPALWINLES